jgi:AraC-like DNA-binding protein
LAATQQDSVISTSVLLSVYNDLGEQRELFNRGLAAHGIRIAELQDFGRYISLRRYVRMLEWLAAELGDPSLGLKLSQRAGPDALGAVGYLFLSSGNLETALQSLRRYLEAVQSSSSTDIRYIDDYVQVQYRIIDESIAPRAQDSEYSIGLIWHYMRLLSKNQCRLAQVTFEHDKPDKNQNIYRHVFDGPVLFGQGHNVLTMHVDEVQRWYEGSDPHLIPILEKHISNTIHQGSGSRTFRETVNGSLTDAVLRQGARAELVASLLKISPATLHRRLRAEDCRFKELVDSRSKAVAERLLRDSNIPVGDISTRLGFTDPAAFCRAFRRWFDTSPRDYRQQLR